ncbi:MAG: glycosyltransferase family 4 protein [Methanothrix sp.]
MIKIAMLSPENSPSWGGVGSYTYNLAKNLPDDVEIHIITINRDVKDSYKNILLKSNIHIHNIVNISIDDSFFYNVKFQIAVFKYLRKLNNMYEFDIIHTHSGHLPHYFSQFRPIAPMIVTVHAETKGFKKARKSIKYKKNSTEILNDLFSPFIQLGEEISFRMARKLLPISEFTLNQINEFYSADVTHKANVIHNGVDTNLFRPNEHNGNDKLTFAFIGRQYAIKGFDIFLECMRDIINQGYDINLLIAGRGDRNYIQNYLKDFYSNNCSVLGRVDYLDMPKVYHRADVIVMPSLYEGCSGAILEAMSSGKIVVASNIGGTPEIIKNGFNGLLFNQMEINSLNNQIINILENTVNLDKIRRNAQETIANNFSWKEKAEEIHREYLNLLS